MSNSSRPHGLKPTKLLHPWDFPGKSTEWVAIAFSTFKEQASFNFMAAVTICSDIGAQKNKVCHCFHCFPIYLPWSDGTRCRDLSFFEC